MIRLHTGPAACMLAECGGTPQLDCLPVQKFGVRCPQVSVWILDCIELLKKAALTWEKAPSPKSMMMS